MKIKKDIKNNENKLNQIISDLGYFNTGNLSNSLDFCDKLNIDAVYSIYVDEGEKSPIIAFKYFDEENSSDAEIDAFHKNLWNFNKVPLSIIVLKDEIRVYNNFSLEEDKKILVKCNDIINKNLQFFNRENLLCGEIWNKYKKNLESSNRVDKRLLKNLKELRRKICIKYDISPSNANSIISECIFIKYLEDRQFISQEVFKKLNYNNFTELLFNQNKNEFFYLVDYIKQMLGGDLFDIINNSIISNECMYELYEFFKGTDIDTGQQYFFLYDFSIIPIELISNIYEMFLDEFKLEEKNSQSAFYTPYYLVDFILKYSLDNKMEEKRDFNIKVLDPACGSGLFLVEALKRLVDKFINLNNRKPNYLEIKEIVEKNIYGIDINLESLKVAALSIYIAILDYLDLDKVYGNKITLPKLIGKNLINGDFFEQENYFNNKKMDIIIGNPPWKRLGISKHKEYATKRRLPISNNQIAESFMFKIEDYVDADTQVVYILTSKILYNSRDKYFRKYILEKLSIDFIIELSLVRKEIFSKAVGPSMIISYRFGNESNEDNSLTYYSLKENLLGSILKKLIIELDDIKELKQSLFIENDNLWKNILVGNEFDLNLINRVKKYEKLNTYINKYNMISGQGFNESLKGNYYPDMLNRKYIKTKKNDNYLDNFFVNYNDAPNLERCNFHRKGNEAVYKGPHLLIKRGISINDKRSVAAVTDKDCVFSNSVNAISFKDNTNLDMLRYLNGIISSKFYSYYQFHTNATWGIERDEVKLEDIRSFPVVPIDKFRELSNELIKKVIEAEKISKLLNDIYNKMSSIELQSKYSETLKNIDNLVYQIYELDNIEIETVNYTHDILMNYSSEKLIKKFKIKNKVSKLTIEEYCKNIIKHFNFMLKYSENKIISYIYMSDLFIMANFKIVNINTNYRDINFVSSDEVNEFIKLQEIISLQEQTDNIYLKKRIKGYGKNSFYLIKTNEYRHWTTMNGIIDINEFSKDICYRGVKSDE